jgi:hypothetical protein
MKKKHRVLRWTVPPGSSCRRYLTRGEADPEGKQARIRLRLPFRSAGRCRKSPLKSSDWVPVENTLNSGSVCQNTAGNPLAQSTPRAIKSGLFWIPGLAHPDPVNPAGMRMGGSFLSDGEPENRDLSRMLREEQMQGRDHQNSCGDARDPSSYYFSRFNFF